MFKKNKTLELEPVIGLEIHLQLKTASKMFCACSNDGENQPANTTICPICLGHPGVLPTVNEKAVEQGLSLALALNCQIQSKSIWARKNYFYPDLPKGYQISQYDKPLALGGYLTIEIAVGSQKFSLERLHLEEDAAKNFHFSQYALVDYNRGGTPLAEIVTKPDFKSPQEARIFLQELRLLARYLNVSEADMEKGHLRCDANISLRPKGDDQLYSKTEIKNLNSFRAVEKALFYEISRQTELWQKNKPPTKQATRGWDEKTQTTVEQRVKESADDYRYFPEPDLASLIISEETVRKLQSSLPELPAAKFQRFMSEYELPASDARVLIDDKDLANFFEEVMSEARAWLEESGQIEGTAEEIWLSGRAKMAKLVVGWLNHELLKLLNEHGQRITELKITPENFAEFVTLIFLRKINSSAGQIVLREMFLTGADPEDVIQDKDLTQVSDAAALDEAVVKIIQANPEQVAQYRAGKTTLLKYFVGLAMKETKGKANPEILAQLFIDKLA